MDRVRVPLAMDDTGMVDEAMNADYERYMSGLPWKTMARRVIREVTRATGRRPNRLLDIACGPSHLLVALAEVAPDIELHGLDLSEHMLDIAARRLGKAGMAERVTLHRGSAYDLPFEGSSFDAVISTDALHCFDDLTALFSEAVRVARPGGAVIVHAWRRDMPWLLGVVMWAHTRYLKATGSHLEGGGPILDASWTGREVLEACVPIGGAHADAGGGVFELVVTIRKPGEAA